MIKDLTKWSQYRVLRLCALY